MLGLGNSLTGGTVLGWTPAEIPSLIHWYRKGVGQESDSGTSNTNCDLWTDQEGSNNLTANGTDDALAPTLNANGTITFDANTDIMTWGTALSLGKFSIYVRLSYGAALGNDYIMENQADSVNWIQLTSETLVKVRITDRQDYTMDPVIPENGTPFNLGAERAENGDIAVFHAGDGMEKTGIGDGNVPISTLFPLTTIGDPATDSTWYEVVICNDALSSADRALLNTYLDSI